MSKPDKDVDAHMKRRQTIEGADAQRDVAGPKREERAWATVNQLPGGGKRIDARRKVPSGPVGGSGRKTNQSRSS